MSTCSQTHFAALTGKMRTEWQSINNAFNRAQKYHSHRLCACQVQSPPNHNELAVWPFNADTLIDLKPSHPVTADQLQQKGIAPAQLQENQK